jgi:hypothetical protein
MCFSFAYLHIHLPTRTPFRFCFDLRSTHETHNHSWSRSFNSLRHNSRTHEQIVLIDAKPSVRKQILRELQIMHDCNSPYIISFYGAFISDPNICICMEFMDKGSLDGIYKQIGAIDIDVVGKVALAVLEGLTYLYDVHRIIHRGELVDRSALLIPSPRPDQERTFVVEVDSLTCILPFPRLHRYQALQHPLQLQRTNQNL